MTGFRCPADSDYPVYAERSLGVPCNVVRTGAFDCGFNWSMQHNDRLWLKECWHESKTADLPHQSSESPNVGSRES